MDKWLNDIPEDDRKDVREEYKNAKTLESKINILKKWHPKSHINIEPIKSLEEYFKYINIATTDSTWFRGEPKKYEFLIPKLYRNIDETEVKEQLEKEKKYFQEFKRKGRSLVTKADSNNIWSWYFLIQHYGGPTRLLDWTKDAAMALFFALDAKSSNDENAVVIILEPTTLIDYAFEDVGCESPEKSSVLYPGENPTDEWINNLMKNNFDLPKFPIPLVPPHSDQRIRAQSSCFTLFGERIKGFYKNNEQIVCPCCGRKVIHRLIIDGNKKEDLRKELTKIGVTSSKVYPGLEGLNKELTEKILNTN